jgi:MFS family permease
MCAYNSNFVTTFLFFFTVSIAAFGMLLGSLMAGPFANLIGRQWASIIGTCGFLAIGYSFLGSLIE